MTRYQRHQLDDMQIIGTSLQTDNHASTSVNCCRPDALPDAQPTVSKHRTQVMSLQNILFFSADDDIVWYGDGAGNTVEENSSVFSLI